MINKKLLAAVIGIVIAVPAGLWVVNSGKRSLVPTPTPEPELPVNTIPVEERPFVTLSPDDSGRNLFFRVDGAGEIGEVEYELVYNATGKQEGVFGRLDLEIETQPIEKKLLLGSQSAGGKITYHEGVTGGSLTLTTAETKLKEQWNFLRFDSKDPVFSSSDGRFAATLEPKELKDNQVVIIMKSFGYPAEIPEGQQVVAGPYTLQTPAKLKKPATIELKLPAGEHVSPTMLGYDGTKWVELKTQVEGDTLTADSTATVFVAVTN